MFGGPIHVFWYRMKQMRPVAKLDNLNALCYLLWNYARLKYVNNLHKFFLSLLDYPIRHKLLILISEIHYVLKLTTWVSKARGVPSGLANARHPGRDKLA